MNRSSGTAYKPYVAGILGQAVLTPPTLTTVAPNTVVSGGGTGGKIAVVLTGTFTNCNNMLLVNGQAEGYATYTDATHVGASILTSKTAGTYKVSVIDAQGQRTAEQTFTVT